MGRTTISKVCHFIGPNKDSFNPCIKSLNLSQSPVIILINFPSFTLFSLIQFGSFFIIYSSSPKSVLRALDNQRQTKLPFENGRHLNLIKDSPVQPANEMISIDTASWIDDMISSSQLEPIREVRRDDALKQQLAGKLEQLVTSATLDKMQLVSFVEALRNPVHLTQ